jgi:hypothetical protein
MQNQIAFLESRIEKLFTEGNKAQNELAYNEINNAQNSNKGMTGHSELIEEGIELYVAYSDIIKHLHLSIACYLEILGLQSYLKTFYKLFGKHEPKNISASIDYDQ